MRHNHDPLTEMRRRWLDGRYMPVPGSVEDWIACECVAQGGSKPDEERWTRAEKEVTKQFRTALGLFEKSSG